MDLNKNHIIAGTSLILVLLLIVMTATGALFMLPHDLYLIINGTLPLAILALLIIALIALMTGESKNIPEKIISGAVIIGLLVIIAGFFVPVLFFEAFVHNQGDGYEIPEGYLDNHTIKYSRDNTTIIDISHKDGWGISLNPDDPYYHAIKTECLEQILHIDSRVKNGFSREEIIEMKQRHSNIALHLPAPAEFNTSYIVDGAQKSITIDEAIFILDSEYNNIIIASPESSSGEWETSGDREKIRELAESVFQGFPDDYERVESGFGKNDSGIDSTKAACPGYNPTILKEYGNWSERIYYDHDDWETFRPPDEDFDQYWLVDGGPVAGCGFDSCLGGISVWWDPDIPINETVMDEVYSLFAERAKTNGMEEPYLTFIPGKLIPD